MYVTNAQKLNKEDSLLQFIIPSQETCRVLLVESPEYLTYVRELLPQAEIHCVVSDLQGVPLDSYAKVDVQWTELNYLQERLTFAQKYFDIILGENLLAQAGNPQDILTGLGLYLKDTGLLMCGTGRLWWICSKAIFTMCAAMFLQHRKWKSFYVHLFIRMFPMPKERAGLYRRNWHRKYRHWDLMMTMMI